MPRYASLAYRSFHQAALSTFLMTCRVKTLADSPRLTHKEGDAWPMHGP